MKILVALTNLIICCHMHKFLIYFVLIGLSEDVLLRWVCWWIRFRRQVVALESFLTQRYSTLVRLVPMVWNHPWRVNHPSLLVDSKKRTWVLCTSLYKPRHWVDRVKDGRGAVWEIPTTIANLLTIVRNFPLILWCQQSCARVQDHLAAWLIRARKAHLR